MTDVADVPYLHSRHNMDIGVYGYRIWHVDLKDDPDHLLTVAQKWPWPHNAPLTSSPMKHDAIFGVSSIEIGDLQSIGYGVPGKNAAPKHGTNAHGIVDFYAAVLGLAEFRKCEFVPTFFSTGEYLTSREVIPKLLWYTEDMEEEVKHLAKLYSVPAEPIPEEIKPEYF